MPTKAGSRRLFPLSFIAVVLGLFQVSFLNAHRFDSTASLTTAEGAVFSEIAKENLKTITALDNGTKSLETTSGENFKKSHEMLLDTLREQLSMNYKQKRRITLMLFSHYEKHHPFEKNMVLDTTSWQDLELLCGPKSDVCHYVAAKIERAQTEAGRIMFFKKLIEPTENVDQLLANQAIIKEFHNNKALFEKIEHHIARLKEAEGAILSFWNHDLFYGVVKQEELPSFGSKGFSRYVNRTPGLVEMNAYSRLCANATNNIAMVAAALLIPWFGVKKAWNFDVFQAASNLVGKPELGSVLLEKVSFLEAGAYMSFAGFVYGTFRWFNQSTHVGASENVVMGITTGYPAVFFPDYLRYVINFRKCIQTKMMYVARYVDALKQLSKITRSNPMLSKQFPVLAHLEKELKDIAKADKNFEQFLQLLDTKTFKGKEASFFSWYGKINVSYQLMHEIKNHLIRPMMVAGELDAYLSCARLVKELEEKDEPICFANYITASQPTLTITDFWNPSVLGRKAITNSLVIGGTDHPKNIIVTGPNAGGKSTTMKGLLVNVVLAQTFGIATARSLVFTPFSKIITYLNITDDIAAGKSHFKAGACRARELIKTAQSVSPSEFSLTAVDEVFNGTTFYEGQAAAYALIEQLSTFPTNICVTITHFPQVPRLEREYPGVFANYKVAVSFAPDGSMIYDYKIRRGVAEQNIALDILKIEGFNDTFLNKAMEILAQNPENKRR